MLAGLLLAAGCASPGYWIDRRRDAADIFTATIGGGAGAKVRAGPLQLAMVENADIIGLKSGAFLADGNSLIINHELYTLPIPLTDVGFGYETYSPGPWTPAYERGKYVRAESKFPCIILAEGNPAYYTQLEVVAGLGLTARLGANPGELLDFILGWTGVDIFNDDLSVRPPHARQETRPRPHYEPTYRIRKRRH